jgi:hypothetical protein
MFLSVIDDTGGMLVRVKKEGESTDSFAMSLGASDGMLWRWKGAATAR